MNFEYSHAVPDVLLRCTRFVEQHGLTDGVYRVSGVTSNIKRLRYVAKKITLAAPIFPAKGEETKRSRFRLFFERQLVPLFPPLPGAPVFHRRVKGKLDCLNFSLSDQSVARKRGERIYIREILRGGGGREKVWTQGGGGRGGVKFSVSTKKGKGDVEEEEGGKCPRLGGKRRIPAFLLLSGTKVGPSSSFYTRRGESSKNKLPFGLKAEIQLTAVKVPSSSSFFALQPRG